MKPSDLYLSSRHFFGYALTGSVSLAAVSLLAGQNPLMFTESGHETVRVLLRLSGFLCVGYVLGFAVQKVFFLLGTIWHTPKCGKETLRKTVSQQSENDGDLPRLCKLFVLENSVQLKAAIMEREVGINLRVGIPPSLCALAVGMMVHGSIHVPSDTTWRLGCIGLVVATIGWYILWLAPSDKEDAKKIRNWIWPKPSAWALSKCRDGEIEEWYRMFIVLTRMAEPSGEREPPTTRDLKS